MRRISASGANHDCRENGESVSSAAGNISDTYFRVARSFDQLEVVACADHSLDRARAQAAKYGLPRAPAPRELLADPEIQIVVNLTRPDAHAEIALAALQAGKSVYNEKPLAVSRDEAQRLLLAAQDKGLRVGCAPDTPRAPVCRPAAS